MQLGHIIRKNLATVICGLVIAMALIGALALRGHAGADSKEQLAALIHDADGNLYELPLSEDATITVTTSLGTNTIAVEDGAVRMLDADCPQRTCLLASPLCSPGRQIICLPHELWIEVAPKGSAGSDMDVTQAQELGDDVDFVAR